MKEGGELTVNQRGKRGWEKKRAVWEVYFRAGWADRRGVLGTKGSYGVY
jgi:hypothetical protein